MITSQAEARPGWLTRSKKMSELDDLKKLLEQMPEHLQSDWYGTNHYEICDYTKGAKDYWWIDIPSLFHDAYSCIVSDTEMGKRMGLIMDVAVASRKVVPPLITEVETLRERVKTLEAELAAKK
jgi:hypothetical protein